MSDRPEPLTDAELEQAERLGIDAPINRERLSRWKSAVEESERVREDMWRRDPSNTVMHTMPIPTDWKGIETEARTVPRTQRHLCDLIRRAMEEQKRVDAEVCRDRANLLSTGHIRPTLMARACFGCANDIEQCSIGIERGEERDGGSG